MPFSFPVLASWLVLLLPSAPSAKPKPQRTWKTVTTTPDFTVAYDSTCMIPVGPHMYQVTTLWHYLRPSSIAGHLWNDGVRSLLTRYALDCGLDRIRILAVASLNASGRPLKVVNMPAQLWEALNHYSARDVLARELCAGTVATR